MAENQIDQPKEQLPSSQDGGHDPIDALAKAPLTSPDQAEIKQLMQQINLGDASSILYFGAQAQNQLTEISDQMLDQVRSKDMGAAGEALTNMVLTLKGFNTEGLEQGKQKGWLSRLLNKATPVARILEEYGLVRDKIELIAGSLEQHKTTLLTDITMLDRLYDATLGYFRQLDVYVMAGEQKLVEIDAKTLPTLAEAAEKSGDLLKTQELRDLRGARDELERRVYDLRLTRQVAMQALPSIRMVQQNNTGLINRINSTLVNTIPLWRQRLAQALAIYRSIDAAEALRAASDLNNELLRANAENLKQANSEARKQIERGVFDIEAIQDANQSLIDSINESLEIADAGKRNRAKAVTELLALETQLRNSLQQASARQRSNRPS